MDLTGQYTLHGQHLHVRLTLNHTGGHLETALDIHDITDGKNVAICQCFYGPAPQADVLNLVADALHRLGLQRVKTRILRRSFQRTLSERKP